MIVRSVPFLSFAVNRSPAAATQFFVLLNSAKIEHVILTKFSGHQEILKQNKNQFNLPMDGFLIVIDAFHTGTNY